jgi:hypothetical protein
MFQTLGEDERDRVVDGQVPYQDHSLRPPDQ